MEQKTPTHTRNGGCGGFWNVTFMPLIQYIMTVKDIVAAL